VIEDGPQRRDSVMKTVASCHQGHMRGEEGVARQASLLLLVLDALDCSSRQLQSLVSDDRMGGCRLAR
jgi:hypothetical protein